MRLDYFLKCISCEENKSALYHYDTNAVSNKGKQSCFVCLFCCFTPQVNRYGHGGTVSSPNHTFFLGKLEQTVNQFFLHILSLVTDNNLS